MRLSVEVKQGKSSIILECLKKYELFNSAFHTSVEENAEDEEHIERSNLQQQHMYEESDTIKMSMQHLIQTTEKIGQGIQQLCRFSSMQGVRAICDSEDSKVDEKHGNSMEVQLLHKGVEE